MHGGGAAGLDDFGEKADEHFSSGQVHRAVRGVRRFGASEYERAVGVGAQGSGCGAERVL